MSPHAAVLHPEFRPDLCWWDEAPPETARDEDLPRRVDVVVVGSGYCGLNAAAAGRDVALLDSGTLGFGASTVIPAESPAVKSFSSPGRRGMFPPSSLP
jgi:hypothetical protein